jgi:hypothetical protein
VRNNHILALLVVSILSTMAWAKSGQQLSNELKIDPSSKAIKQWERIFSTEDKLKQMGIDKLSASDKAELKKFLIDHAADSDKPTVAGR